MAYKVERRVIVRKTLPLLMPRKSPHLAAKQLMPASDASKYFSSLGLGLSSVG